MAKKYQKIFFDLDGTITDSFVGIENGIHFALEKSGMNGISSDEIKSSIGIPLTDSLKKYCLNDVEKTTEAVELFREYYASKGITESELYPGMYDLLAWASNYYSLYVITAKPTVYAIQLLKYQNIAKFFIEIKGCHLEVGNFKKSDLIREVNGDNVVSLIIGDKKQDIEAGKETGIRTCGVLYGYGTEKEIKESDPDYIAASVMDLKNILSF